jgi:hypothetical protein
MDRCPFQQRNHRLMSNPQPPRRRMRMSASVRETDTGEITGETSSDIDMGHPRGGDAGGDRVNHQCKTIVFVRHRVPDNQMIIRFSYIVVNL